MVFFPSLVQQTNLASSFCLSRMFLRSIVLPCSLRVPSSALTTGAFSNLLFPHQSFCHSQVFFQSFVQLPQPPFHLPLFINPLSKQAEGINVPPPQIRALSCISLPTPHTILSQLPSTRGSISRAHRRGCWPLAEKSGLGPQLPSTGLGDALPNCHDSINPSIKKKKEEKKRVKERQLYRLCACGGHVGGDGGRGGKRSRFIKEGGGKVQTQALSLSSPRAGTAGKRNLSRLPVNFGIGWG